MHYQKYSFYKIKFNQKYLSAYDLVDERKVFSEEGMQKAEHYEIFYYETSAKNRIGSNSMIEMIINETIEKIDKNGESQINSIFLSPITQSKSKNNWY